MALLKAQTLSITFSNLDIHCDHRTFSERLISASNPFMLRIKLEKFLKRNIYVHSFSFANAKGIGGNTGINAEAYLWEHLEDLENIFS